MEGRRSKKTGIWLIMGVLMLLLVCLVNALLLCLRFPDGRIEARAGRVLSEDLLYPFSGTDAYRTDELRQAARDRTEPVYRLDETIVQAQAQALEGWFTQYDLFLKEMTLRWEEGAQSITASSTTRPPGPPSSGRRSCRPSSTSSAWGTCWTRP